jgi:hypothetical protein
MPETAPAGSTTAGAKMRADLAEKKVSELAALARAEGVDVERIAHAIDGDKPKFELVELVLRARAKVKRTTGATKKKASDVPPLTGKQIVCVLASTVLVLLGLSASACLLTNACRDAFTILNAVGVGIQSGHYQAPSEGDGALKLTTETFDGLIGRNTGVGKTTVVEFYGTPNPLPFVSLCAREYRPTARVCLQPRGVAIANSSPRYGSSSPTTWLRTRNSVRKFRSHRWTAMRAGCCASDTKSKGFLRLSASTRTHRPSVSRTKVTTPLWKGS